MPEFNAVPGSFPNLEGKVVVLTGGAHGVGESVVRKLYAIGAHIFFGDIDESACQRLAEDLLQQQQKADAASSTSASGSNGRPTISYRKLDVRSYEDNLALFRLAYDTMGRVDHAFSIAGVTEGQNWFDQDLDLETISAAPSTSVLDINLLGALYFARIAAVYLRQGNATHAHDKSLLLTGSIASFKEQAGLFVYQPAKHGVLGLLRSSRKLMHQVFGIRINAICPSLINTGMAAKIHPIFQRWNLPVNEPSEVADYILTVAALSKLPNPDPDSDATDTDLDLSGLAFHIEGGKAWEIERPLRECEPIWLGPEMTSNVARLEEALGVGNGWTQGSS